MTRHEFRNAACLLNSIDAYEFLAATRLRADCWPMFRDDPLGTFLRMGDEAANGLWALVESRQSPRAESLAQAAE